MTRNISSVLLVVVFMALSCAPHDDGTSKKVTPNKDDDVSPPKSTPVVPQTLKTRIEAALKHVGDRDLEPQFGFWTIFHGILGQGPETATLLDRKTGQRVKAIDWVCDGKPMPGLKFVVHEEGLDVETQVGTGIGQGHQDQFVAEMSQWGLPAKRIFRVNGKDYTFSDFHRYSKMRTSVSDNQELSWAIVIISQYYGTDVTWTNLKKEKLKFEDVVRYELDQPIDTAACGGTHRLFGLTWAYHLHLRKGGKSTGVWKDAADKIELYKQNARKFQNPDGSFSSQYVSGPGEAKDSGTRIGTTGHVLEWLALAMTDDELKQEWMQNAADALVRMILDNRSAPIDGGALYHATHGLHIYYNRLFGPLGNDPLIPLPPK